jgi:anti-sigma regulatory factor (Ser/Thr protein kinase)
LRAGGQAIGAEDSVQLTLVAKAENVAVVRHALAGLAAALEMEAGSIADLKTVVTEACMNVVVHAYEPGVPGPLQVRAWRDEPWLVVAVRDYGTGIRPLAEPERDSLRLGLPLIAALSTRFEITGEPGHGTEVTMRLALSTNGAAPAVAEEAKPPEGAQLRLPAGDLVAPVLSRVIGMYAARADFSVDRLSDAILLSDAISASEPATFRDRLAEIEIGEEEGAFTVRLGPLEPGAGERMMGAMRIPELGVSLDRLADEMSVQADDRGEYLVMRLARPD